MNTQTITLDISKQAAQTPVVTIGQCDSSGTTIKAKVYDNGIAADLDGMDAMFEMRLPDGKSYVRDGNCTVSGNEITYVVDEEHCAAVEGYSDECYFDILDGPSVIYSTARFRVVVMRSAHNASIEAMPWDSEVDELIERGDAYMDYVEQYGIPAMSSTVRGGAKLGSGLAIADEALSVDPITSAQIDSVAADSSMTGAQSLSLTGLTRLWVKAKAAFAAMTHSHAASDITSGTLGVARGGTGKSAVPSMLADLASENAASPYDATPRPGVTGLLPVAHGGTGASTAAAARANLDAAQSENAAGSLYDAEQAIADNAAAIATLGESVSQIASVDNLLQSSVTAGQSATLLKSVDDYRFVSIRIGDASDSQSTRNRLVCKTGSGAFYMPVVVSESFQCVRFEMTGKNFNFLSNTGGTVLVVRQLYGIR